MLDQPAGRLQGATSERSLGQEADVFVGNLVDERHGGPISIGYGRYAPGQSLAETMAVDDLMIIPEGRLTVSPDAGTVYVRSRRHICPRVTPSPFAPMRRVR